MNAYFILTALLLSFAWFASCEVDNENVDGKRLFQLRPVTNLNSVQNMISLSSVAINMRTMMPSEAIDIKCSAYAHLFRIVNREHSINPKVVRSLADVIIRDRLLYYKLFLDNLNSMSVLNFVQAVEQLELVVPKKMVFGLVKVKSNSESEAAEAAMMDLLACLVTYMNSNDKVVQFLAENNRLKLGKKASASSIEDNHENMQQIPQNNVSKIVDNIQNRNIADETIESLDDEEVLKARQDLAKAFTQKINSNEEISSKKPITTDLDNPERLEFLEAVRSIALRIVNLIAMEENKGFNYPPVSLEIASSLLENWAFINKQSIYLPPDARMIRSNEEFKEIISKVQSSVDAITEAGKICDELDSLKKSPKLLNDIRERVVKLIEIMAKVDTRIDAGEVGRRARKWIAKNREYNVMSSFIGML